MTIVRTCGLLLATSAVLHHGADIAASCEADESCDEEASLLQSARVARLKRERPKIAIFTTAGAGSLCCDCPANETSCCQFLHTHKHTWNAARDAKQAIEEAGGSATIYDIDQKGGCPPPYYDGGKLSGYDLGMEYDGFMIGSPVWFGNPTPDMLSFINSRFQRENEPRSLACKPGAAFATGGAVYGGVQQVIEALHREMMTSQMIVVGGPHWHNAVGAGAVTAEYPFNKPAPGAKSKEEAEVLSPIFSIDVKGLAERLTNFTRALMKSPPMCGAYAGLNEKHNERFEGDDFVR